METLTEPKSRAPAKNETERQVEGKPVAIPEVMVIAATRVLLGVGLGMLLSNKLPRGRRAQAAIPLIVSGVMSTIPLVLEILSRPVVKARMDD